MTMNQQWRVNSHVQPGETVGPEHFELVTAPIPDIGRDEFLARTLVLGLSPAQRGYIDARARDLVGVGEVMRGRGVAVVEQSNHPDFRPGDWVHASTGWQEWSVQRLDRGEVQSMNVLAVQKVDRDSGPSSVHLGSLGSAAFAALYGIEDICEVSARKTVVVSAAAGGVGSMACQIAKAHGARVVGIAGGPTKCDWVVRTVGCDAAIDYKNDDLTEALAQHCPDGVDCFFDNVGGRILNGVLEHLAMGARVAVCGYISTDYAADSPPGPSNYVYLLRSRARMEGFVIMDQVHRFPEFFEKLNGWMKEGKLTRDVEEVKQGIERLPESLQSLFLGGNTGIRLVQVLADPP